MSDVSLKLDLTLNDTNTILSGLSELPAKMSFDVINKIKMQATPQLAAVESAQTEGQQVLTEGGQSGS